jgi:5-oxoprolinase (ATP-hydrolysing) subunit A
VRIDLNADVGESFGAWRLGEDDRLIPLVSSVNVACGFHAGDPQSIERTIVLAIQAGCAIGAHPGYPDLPGFGRRDLAMSAAEIQAALIYQVGAVAAFARAAGSELRHVKPHGALYNRAATDRAVAEAIARGVRRVSSELVLVGLAGSVMLDAGRAAGLVVAAEAFADRRYEPTGHLRSRSERDALIDDPGTVGQQAVALARDQAVTAIDGSRLAIAADTICIHGDLPGAADRAAAARTALEAAGIEVGPLRA